MRDHDSPMHVVAKEWQTVLSPQLCDPDIVLDAAECLAGQAGLEALTIRTVTKATAISTAAIYQMYGSREGLIGHAWLRAARRYVSLLTSLIDEAHATGTPLDEMFAAAETSLYYPKRYPRSGALLLVVSRAELLGLSLPDDIIDQLRSVDHEFLEAITRLSIHVWDRKDAHALGVISGCVLDLPKHILTRRRRYPTTVVREYLRAAIRGIVEVGPPPAPQDH